MDLIAPHQQPVHVIQTPATSINSHQGATAFGFVQLQGDFGCFHQRSQGPGQLNGPTKEPIHHHLIVVAGQHPTQLPSPPIALVGEIAGCLAKAAFFPQGIPLMSTSSTCKLAR